MAHPIENTVKYFCPLSATVYSRGRYGDWEDYLDVYDGIFLVSHEKKINVDSLIEKGKKLYLLGSKPGVAELAAEARND